MTRILALLLALGSSPAWADAVIAVTCPGTVASGAQFEATVAVDANADPLGAYSTTVTFNPQKLSFLSVAGGTDEFAATPVNALACPTTSLCNLKLASFQAASLSEPTEVSTVAKIRFQAFMGGTGVAVTPTVPVAYDTDAVGLTTTGTACSMTVTCLHRGQTCGQDMECCSARCRPNGKCH